MTESENFVKQTYPGALARREGKLTIILRLRTDQDPPSPHTMVRLSGHQKSAIWAWDEAAARLVAEVSSRLGKQRRDHATA
jgi:hypothetical protein